MTDGRLQCLSVTGVCDNWCNWCFWSVSGWWAFPFYPPVGICTWFCLKFVLRMHDCVSFFLILSMRPPASPQPHVLGALHDVPDGTAARGLLAPPHLLQEFSAGWWWWRYHVGDEWLLQQRLLCSLQEDQAPCCYSWNFSSQEEAARRSGINKNINNGVHNCVFIAFFFHVREKWPFTLVQFSECRQLHQYKAL